MKRLFKCLFLILPLLLSVVARGAELHPERDARGVFRGAQMHLIFSNLKPGERYFVRIVPDLAGFGFTGSMMGPPEGIRIDRDQLDFVAPEATKGEDSISEHFTVGVFLPAHASLHTNLSAPASLEVQFDAPRMGHSQAFRAGPAQPFYVEGRSEIPIQSVPAPFGCLEGVECSLTKACPVRKPPVKCFGPIVGTFFCCRSDPFPP